MTAASSGLDGVVVADTAISGVDGELGRLVIAGVEVEALAGSIDFAGAAARVLSAAGMQATAEELARELGAARERAWPIAERARAAGAFDTADGMDALRGGLALVHASGDDRADAVTAIGAAPVLVAAWHRARSGEPAIEPDPRVSHAADYLRMTLGAPTTDAATRALDAYLVTVIDHGLNASTFAARVVASTASDLVSAVVAGVGALKGPLHGGAPGPVLDMLDAIGAPARAEAWLVDELAAGRRIMGMGHRIYRVRDPRAAVLERALAGLSSPRLALARAVETAAAKILRERKPDRPLAANVEFYTAVLLDAVGLPRDQFAPTFAIGRVAGWCAHVLEQRAVGKLIRPASRYVGG